MTMMMMMNRQSRRRQALRSRRTLSGRSSSSPSIETIPSARNSAATNSDKNATHVLVIIVVVFVVCATPELIHRLVSGQWLVVRLVSAPWSDTTVHTQTGQSVRRPTDSTCLTSSYIVYRRGFMREIWQNVTAGTYNEIVIVKSVIYFCYFTEHNSECHFNFLMSWMSKDYPDDLKKKQAC